MSRRGSTRAWRKLRAYVLARDGHTCQRPRPSGAPCGQPATDAGHILADALGGTNHPDNLRAECEQCNSIDGGRLGLVLRAASAPPAVSTPPVVNSVPRRTSFGLAARLFEGATATRRPALSESLSPRYPPHPRDDDGH